MGMGIALKLIIIPAMVLLAASCSMKNYEPVADLATVQQLYAEGDYRGAVQGYERLVEQAPQDDQLWFRLANAYARLGQPEAAVAAYRNALLRNPDQAKAWHNLAEIHLQMALQVYLEAAQHMQPDDPLQQLLKSKRQKLIEVLDTDAIMER
ncbi:hypothetical protein DPPLL_32860 [Desulfofustis limnaeus]|uniref:Tetratricopeptide repeat protein n=2 Tax=Desulfofustis limnaeus TaxID=2740163 RepID=A0ABM7WD93_9BACT|nr:hypothetical protein DPPLL_32860 [Desulfofustis limnaeus]